MSDQTECKTCHDEACSTSGPRQGENEARFIERRALEARLSRIRHKLVVLSGKGGVGKSTVAVNLARGLALAGKRVGLLDVDIHGPSIPKLLQLEGRLVQGTEEGIEPVELDDGLKVMSIGFLIRDRDEAVIWRGPRKYSMIKHFLTDVNWGDLDYLVVDAPPGTGDEPLAVVELIGKLDGAVIVTTPQELAIIDVRKSIVFCRHLNLPVTGVVENMSGLVCPHCAEPIPVFGSGGGEAMAREMAVPFLGTIPLDPRMVTAGDSGRPIIDADPHAETSKAFGRIIRTLIEPELESAGSFTQEREEGSPMKIAVPVANGTLCPHFGHCERFMLYDVDPETKSIQGSTSLTPPPHEPGVLPRWLHEQGANVIIAGGMGARAQSLFTENRIDVVVGAPSEAPEQVIQAYLEGRLVAGRNLCDH